ncbi:hypothetical protein CNR34_00157 [Pseudomonas phage nickie]|uniref:Uncharacterized protein n=1 Tax=Pseudomonas phage nickie TaxID=2048977 RepID=A0A2H4P7S4_9CAUD|nr:hypothetical protein FDJ16_gp008 [Pseudomonas phage nickie]ATW58090.1 hypothetical protein CNR34_00157 [Pseudomonas phage nickie]
MFYLVTQSDRGHRLVDFSLTSADLMSQIETLQNDNAAGTPVIFSDPALKAAYLHDEFGIVAQEADGYLVELSDL